MESNFWHNFFRTDLNLKNRWWHRLLFVAFIIAFIALMVLYFSGFIGLLILAVATFIGLVPNIAEVSRSNSMACLLVPIILLNVL